MMPKIKPHIIVLLAFLLCVGIILPVSAYYNQMDINTAVVNASDIKKVTFTDVTSVGWSDTANSTGIYGIHLDVPQGAIINYTLTYGSGSTVTGSAYYISVYPGSSIRYVEMNGYYEQQGFDDLTWVVGRQEFIISYASNISDTDGSLISQGFMIQNPGLIGQNIRAYFPAGDFSQNIITKADIQSNLPMDAVILTAPQDTILKGTGDTSVDWLVMARQWVNLAISIAGQVYNFVMWMLGIIKFFFIDNLLLTLALYLSVTLAYSAMTSVTTRGFDVFRFYKQFIGFQRSLLKFMMEIWGYLIQIISQFRDIFRI